jgi:hypothetical protein
LTNKKLFGGFIAVFLVAGVAGGFAGYYFPRLDFGSFNPTIDGNFSTSDGWRFAKWQFIEYLTLDENSTNTNNYFYVHLTDEYLYVLIDFCGDTTGDKKGEWLTIWIDTDNSQTTYSHTGKGGGMLCYLTESSSYNETFHHNGNLFETNLNSSKVNLGFSFQSTVNSKIEHRVFELRIDSSIFEDDSQNDFAIAFLGYGTKAVPYPKKAIAKSF